MPCSPFPFLHTQALALACGVNLRARSELVKQQGTICRSFPLTDKKHAPKMVAVERVRQGLLPSPSLAESWLCSPAGPLGSRGSPGSETSELLNGQSVDHIHGVLTRPTRWQERENEGNWSRRRLGFGYAWKHA
jgi:hypothetical protein